MNTEAIIEKLLLIEAGHIPSAGPTNYLPSEQDAGAGLRNTSIEDLNLPIRVYRSLWRSHVRTVGDVAKAWGGILRVRNIGERARGEIMEALQAWSRSIPDFTTADDVERQGQAEAHPESPIETLHLSQRTYLLLRRHRIHTLGDLYREWENIPAFRNVGPKIWGEIQMAVGLTGLPPHEMQSDADAEQVRCERHLTPGEDGL